MLRRTFNASVLGALGLGATGPFLQASGAEARPRRSGVLRACASYEPGSLDIHKIQAGNMLWQARLLYDGLIYLDAAGRPAPWLARSWMVSPDGRTYVFQLREDVTFSDGVVLDAEAVRANFERIRGLGGQSRISAAYLGPYRESVALSPSSLAVHLDAPFPGFLPFLAQVWMGLISPRQIRDAPEAIEHGAIGSGPFVVASYAPGRRVEFRRREDYRWAPAALAHQGPALLDGVVIEAVRSDADRTSGLKTGVFDVDLEASPQSAGPLGEDPGFAFSNRIRPGAPMRGLSFNTARFPFDQPEIRRAAALAIDRRTITRDFSAGQYLAKSDYLGSNTAGYDDRWRAALDFDPAAAARTLDKAGWSQRAADGVRVRDGVRLSAELVTTGDERTPPRTVAAMRDNLHDVGLELRLRGVSSAQLADAVRLGQYDAVAGGWWSAATPDVLFLLYHSSQIARQNSFGQDTARISDRALDDLLLRAWQAPDQVRSRALYDQAQGRLVELAPVVSLHESHHLFAYRRGVRGLAYDTTHNTPLLTKAWLEPAG